MKTLRTLLVIAIAIFGFTATSFGQATGTASASATIVTPITISKTVDMNFGNVSVSASTGGTVILSPAGSRSTGGAGGVALALANTGTVTAASFTVSGQANYTYAITLPSSDVTLTGPSSNTMIVNAFTSSPTPTGTLGAGGTQVLTVGATLNVTAGQATGLYTNATGVPVTVNYN